MVQSSSTSSVKTSVRAKPWKKSVKKSAKDDAKAVVPVAEEEEEDEEELPAAKAVKDISKVKRKRSKDAKQRRRELAKTKVKDKKKTEAADMKKETWILPNSQKRLFAPQNKKPIKDLMRCCKLEIALSTRKLCDVYSDMFRSYYYAGRGTVQQYENNDDIEIFLSHFSVMLCLCDVMWHEYEREMSELLSTVSSQFDGMNMSHCPIWWRLALLRERGYQKCTISTSSSSCILNGDIYSQSPNGVQNEKK